MIAGGALVLLASFRMDGLAVLRAEQDRQARNVGTSNAVGAGSTFAGSILLLLSHRWVIAGGVALGVLTVWYFALSVRRHRVLRGVRRDVAASKKFAFVPWGYGPKVGLGEIEFDDPITSRMRKLDRIAKREGGRTIILAGRPMSETAEAETLRRATERSRLRYALRHPLGKRHDGL